MVTILMSDGLEADVQPLGIFELDPLAPEPMGRYAYKMTFVSGEEELVEFPLERYLQGVSPIPEKPEIPEHLIEEKSREWYQLLTWQRYEAALHHETIRMNQVEEYAEAVAKKILNDCISDDVRARITNDEDWRKIYEAALVPQLTQELLVETLKKTYKAKFDDDEVFDALQKTSGGLGVYDGIRLWENQLMLGLGLLEEEYATIPLAERARKVCALKLNDWLSHLQLDRDRKKAEMERSMRKK